MLVSAPPAQMRSSAKALWAPSPPSTSARKLVAGGALGQLRLRSSPVEGVCFSCSSLEEGSDDRRRVLDVLPERWRQRRLGQRAVRPDGCLAGVKL